MSFFNVVRDVCTNSTLWQIYTDVQEMMICSNSVAGAPDLIIIITRDNWLSTSHLVELLRCSDRSGILSGIEDQLAEAR